MNLFQLNAIYFLFMEKKQDVNRWMKIFCSEQCVLQKLVFHSVQDVATYFAVPLPCTNFCWLMYNRHQLH